MTSIKLSEYARRHSVTRLTAYRWYREGKIPNAEQLPTGTIIVHLDEPQKEDYTVVYARVSSTSQRKTNLESQAERVAQFCNAKGWVVKKTIKEVGSGLNEKRQRLQELLTDKKVTRIVVEHKDRLTRFGFAYLETLLKNQGVELVVINESVEDKEDLIADFTSIITSFCTRIYGQRRGKLKREQLTKELDDNENSENQSERKLF